MQLDFEPHSWYMHAAIKSNVIMHRSHAKGYRVTPKWQAVYLNGMTGYIVDFGASSLKKLRAQIKAYKLKESERVAQLYQDIK